MSVVQLLVPPGDDDFLAHCIVSGETRVVSPVSYTHLDVYKRQNQLSIVQQSMIDAGVVQSGYNDPAAALIITDLLGRHPDTTREQAEDALSGLFSRDGGYQQMFEAIELAQARIKDPLTKMSAVPEFRDDLVLSLIHI